VIPKGVRHVAGGALFLLGAGSGSWGARALADEAMPEVMVMRSTGGDVGLVEIATRAWAELNAGGVAATLVDCVGEGDACRSEAPSPRRNSITLRTFRRDGETITEVALTPAGRDRPTVRRSLTVSDEVAADPKVTAIRAVELVNAMLLQVDSAAAESAEALRRAAIDAEFPGQHGKPEQRVVEPLAGHDRSWSLGAGGSFLNGTGGLGAALGFAVRAAYSDADRVGVFALVSGTPSARFAGALAANQQIAELELTYRLFQNPHVRSHLAVGSGVYHANARWSAATAVALAETNDTVWVLLVSGGGGGELALGHEMSLFVEAEAISTLPHPILAGPDHRTLTANPSLLLSIGVQRAF
jgi:hypothetical protein